MWLIPSGIFWAGESGRPILAIWVGQKSKPGLELWAEQEGDGWSKTAALPDVSWPEVVRLDRALGVVSSVGKDPRGGYGNSIRFFRIEEGKEPAGSEVATPPSPGDRITVSGVAAEGGDVSIFMLLERRDPPGPGGALTFTNMLLFSRSKDGGKTWGKPVEMGATTMHEDASHGSCIRFGEGRFGRLVMERDRSLFLHRSMDGGETWSKEQVCLEDELGNDATRVPLRLLPVGKEIGMIYLASAAGKRGSGRYCFARSADQGKSWGKGSPITGDMKLEDPSIFVRAESVGERITMAYIEVAGRWTEGEMRCRLTTSADGGKTWESLPLDRFYSGVALFSALAASPSGDRILFSTSICMDPKANPRNFVAVQEISMRPSDRREPTAKEVEEIRHLVAETGNADFEKREDATRRLAAFGRIAKAELMKARRSKDPEVAARADRALSEIFPECIRLED